MLFKKKQDALERYSDPSGELTNRTFKLADWYIRHKLLLQRIGFWLLVSWNVVTIGYGLIAWGNYIIFGLTDDSRLLVRQAIEFQDYQSQHPRYGAQPVQVDDVRAVISAPGRYDFIASVGNPNARWIAEISYQFQHSGGVTDIAKTTLLPGEKRPVALFGQETSQFPVGIQFSIADIRWKKINAHVIPDVNAYVQERILFETENLVFTPARTKDNLTLHRLQFDLKNLSAYTYADPSFYVVARNGGFVTGIIPLTFDKLRAGETMPVDLRSSIESLQATDIDIISLNNIFDPHTFLAPEA